MFPDTSPHCPQYGGHSGSDCSSASNTSHIHLHHCLLHDEEYDGKRCAIRMNPRHPTIVLVAVLFLISVYLREKEKKNYFACL